MAVYEANCRLCYITSNPRFFQGHAVDKLGAYFTLHGEQISDPAFFQHACCLTSSKDGLQTHLFKTRVQNVKTQAIHSFENVSDDASGDALQLSSCTNDGQELRFETYKITQGDLKKKLMKAYFSELMVWIEDAVICDGKLYIKTNESIDMRPNVNKELELQRNEGMEEFDEDF